MSRYFFQGRLVRETKNVIKRARVVLKRAATKAKKIEFRKSTPYFPIFLIWSRVKAVLIPQIFWKAPARIAMN